MTQDDDRSADAWPAHDTDDGTDDTDDGTGPASGTESASSAEQAPGAESAIDSGSATETAGEQHSVTGRRKRRGRWVAVAVVVLLVAALGVVLAQPSVSNRLMLPWAPNKPKGDPPDAAAVQRTLHGPSTGTEHQPSSDGVAAALKEPLDDSALGKLTGTVIDAASGDTLWDDDPGKARTPASTTKLLTSGAALLSMSPDHRIPTEVVAGDDPGTVVLVAHGDVTLSSLATEKDSIYPDAAHLDELVDQVKKSTDGDVQRVALDLSAYSGKTTGPGWADEDTKYYTADAVPTMLDGGREKPTADESDRVGNPAGKLLHEFADRLDAKPAAKSTVTAPKDARSLGKVESAPLTTLVRRCLELSDNVLADALARQVAMHQDEEASFSGAATATRQVLASHDFDVDGLRLRDGSGLSPKNRIPAGLLGELLAVTADPAKKAGARTAALRPILAGLPVAGGTGTLTDRYDDDSTEGGRGWVRAKTGTLSKVSTLAGTVLDSDGRLLVFAFMSSGTDLAKARPALDALAAKLRTCGCESG